MLREPVTASRMTQTPPFQLEVWLTDQVALALDQAEDLAASPLSAHPGEKIRIMATPQTPTSECGIAEHLFSF